MQKPLFQQSDTHGELISQYTDTRLAWKTRSFLHWTWSYLCLRNKPKQLYNSCLLVTLKSCIWQCKDLKVPQALSLAKGSAATIWSTPDHLLWELPYFSICSRPALPNIWAATGPVSNPLLSNITSTCLSIGFVLSSNWNLVYKCLQMA